MQHTTLPLPSTRLTCTSALALRTKLLLHYLVLLPPLQPLPLPPPPQPLPLPPSPPSVPFLSTRPPTPPPLLPLPLYPPPHHLCPVHTTGDPSTPLVTLPLFTSAPCPRSSRYTATLPSLLTIYREEGPAALYKVGSGKDMQAARLGREVDEILSTPTHTTCAHLHPPTPRVLISSSH